MTFEELRREALNQGYILRKVTTEHKQVYIPKYEIECDEGIAGLILLLNEMNWKTSFSCQGNNKGAPAYIMMEGLTFANACIVMKYGLVTNGGVDIGIDWKCVDSERYRVIFRRNRILTTPTDTPDDDWIEAITQKLNPKVAVSVVTEEEKK
jgi:hypothetical protein